jgi:hypothetical protein
MNKEIKSPEIQTDKILMTEIAILRCAIDGTDNFLENPAKPDKIEMILSTTPRFDFTHNSCRFRLELFLNGRHNDDSETGLTASFIIDFIYIIENLTDFIVDHEGENHIAAVLGATLLGISFSTTRGIVMERTKGTPFAGFILPIINPSKVLFETLATPEKKLANPRPLNRLQKSKPGLRPKKM